MGSRSGIALLGWGEVVYKVSPEYCGLLTDWSVSVGKLEDCRWAERLTCNLSSVVAEVGGGSFVPD